MAKLNRLRETQRRMWREQAAKLRAIRKLNDIKDELTEYAIDAGGVEQPSTPGQPGRRNILFNDTVINFDIDGILVNGEQVSLHQVLKGLAKQTRT